MDFCLLESISGIKELKDDHAWALVVQPRAELELALGPVSWGFHLSELPLSQLGGRDSHTHFAREP